MDRELILRMAQEAGIPFSDVSSPAINDMARFAELVAADCAAIAEERIDPDWPNDDMSAQAREIGAEIFDRFRIPTTP